jgi:hypothetical protein
MAQEPGFLHPCCHIRHIAGNVPLIWQKRGRKTGKHNVYLVLP